MVSTADVKTGVVMVDVGVTVVAVNGVDVSKTILVE